RRAVRHHLAVAAVPVRGAHTDDGPVRGKARQIVLDLVHADGVHEIAGQQASATVVDEQGGFGFHGSISPGAAPVRMMGRGRRGARAILPGATVWAPPARGSLADEAACSVSSL